MANDFIERRREADALSDVIATQAARLDAGEHQLLATIRRFDELRGWRVQGARSCAAWLSWRIGVGPNAAREKVRVAQALATLPLIDEALRRGQISYAKARAMTRVASPANEELLLAQARGTTGAQLERICARFRKFLPGALTHEDVRYVRRRTSRDGTVKIEMSLLPDEAELLWQALKEKKGAMAAEQTSEGPKVTLADAAVALAQQSSVSDEAGAGEASTTVGERRQDGAASGRSVMKGPEARRPELVVHVHLIEGEPGEQLGSPGERVSAETGTDDFARASDVSVETRPGDLVGASDVSAETPRRFHAELDDGTPLCGDTFKRLACDAGLDMALISHRGTAPRLDIGRKRRTLSPPLSRALSLRDRTCRFPGCSQRAFLHAHHIEHWANGGGTNLENLVRLCHFHHVAVHEGGFRVERRVEHATADERDVVFLDAVGREIPSVALSGSANAIDSPITTLAAQQSAADIHIDARTSLPRCGGLSFRDIDMNGCVRALVRRSEASLTDH